MKVCIVIITYNLDSRIFLLQIEAIRKFCKDDFVIEIIDNSSNDAQAEAIRYHAQQQNVSYIRTHSVIQNGSESHAFAANLSYERFKDYGYGIMVYFDHDLIPVKPFSIAEILGDDYVMGGMAQGKNGKTYFWPGLFFYNAKKVDGEFINFLPVTGLDTGGSLYKAVEHYGIEKCVFFDEAYYQNPYFKGRLYNHYVLINSGMFLHCINASGWNKIEDQEERINSLVTIIREKIDANVD